MEKYMKSQVKYYSVLVGHKKLHFIHPLLFVGRKEARDKNGRQIMSQDNYPKTYCLQDEQLREEIVKTWSSQADKLAQLPQAEKNAINSIKQFMNREEWRILAVFHDKTCDLDDHVYGNHLHMVMETDAQNISRMAPYRNMKRNVDVLGGKVGLKLIRNDVSAFVHYLSDDDEKVFLGANSESLLRLFVDSEQETANMSAGYLLEDAEEPSTRKQPKDIPWSYATEQPVTVSYNDEDTASCSSDVVVKAEIPKHHQNKKAAESVTFLTDLLRAHPKCRDINSLIASQTPFSPTWSSLINVASSTHGNKTFGIALAQIMKEFNSKTAADIIRELPDTLPGYMSVRKSQAMFNAWCLEQRIKPKDRKSTR